jgi:hypothetical protein
VEHPEGLPDQVLDALVAGMSGVLGDDLVALWLYGSSVTGDFEAGVSDIDLIAVTTAGIDAADLAGLGRMHDDLVFRHGEWRNRIEVVYVAQPTLESFRTSTDTLAVISPGEPLHFREDRPIAWLQNWYLVRETGVALHGPKPAEIVPPVAWSEFVSATVSYAEEVRGRNRTGATSGALAYDVLTVCRAFRTVHLGTLSSKLDTAAWVGAQMPEWRWLIDAAVDCRRSGGMIGFGDDGSRDAAERFIRIVADEIVIGRRS